MTLLRRVLFRSLAGLACFSLLTAPAAYSRDDQPPPANEQGEGDKPKTPQEEPAKTDEEDEEAPKITPEEAQKFLSATVAANQQLEKAARPLGEAIRPVFADKPADLKAFDEAYAAIDKALGEVEKAAREWKVPASDSAAAYFKKYQQFLQAQRTVFEDDLAKLKEALADDNLDAEAKRKRAVELLKSIDKKVAVAHAPLREAQVVFADEYELKIMPAKKEEESEQ